MFSLAPYSTIEEKNRNRKIVEDESLIRSPFQRDRDRIIHSKAFRRLEYKTQVFVNHLGDNFRTRLTHSIEVSQISRTVANILNVNETLVETIALAHDLGHPPFGHIGENILHNLMCNYGGFDHNEQTLRVVTILEERYPNFLGLNLTEATLLGLQKHNHLPNNHSHSIEAQIVDICDEIAYNNHDIDDGLDSGLLTLKQLNTIELWQQAWLETISKYPNVSDKIKIRTTIRNLINVMVMNLVENTKQNIKKFKIENFDDVLNFKIKHPNEDLVHFSSDMKLKVAHLKKFLHKELYHHPKVENIFSDAKQSIEFIFNKTNDDVYLLPIEYQHRIQTEGKHRSICDFIAGMTDRYALNWKP